MKSHHRSRNFFRNTIVALVFVGAVILMINGFRCKNGPWSLTYFVSDSGRISLKVSNPHVAPLGVKIESNLLATSNFQEINVVFNKEIHQVPHGSVLVQDITVFPGYVAMTFAGVSIDLFERSLGVQGQGLEWKVVDGTTIHPGMGRLAQ